MSDAHDVKELLPSFLSADVPLVVNEEGDVVTDPDAGIFPDEPSVLPDFDDLSERDQESIIARAEAGLDEIADAAEATRNDEILELREQRYRAIARATGLFPTDEILESFPARNPSLLNGSYDDVPDEELETAIRALAVAERTDHTGDAWRD